jgi:hypothetical protein
VLEHFPFMPYTHVTSGGSGTWEMRLLLASPQLVAVGLVYCIAHCHVLSLVLEVV